MAQETLILKPKRLYYVVENTCKLLIICLLYMINKIKVDFCFLMLNIEKAFLLLFVMPVTHN